MLGALGCCQKGLARFKILATQVTLSATQRLDEARLFGKLDLSYDAKPRPLYLLDRCDGLQETRPCLYLVDCRAAFGPCR